MAGQERMTTEEVVRKVLVDEHADVSRESLELLVRELMEVEVSDWWAPSSASGVPRTGLTEAFWREFLARS